MEDTRNKVQEERDKENRTKNIILYRVPESADGTGREERIKEDKEFCHELIGKALEVDIIENDISKIIRLGKKTKTSVGQFYYSLEKGALKIV